MKEKLNKLKLGKYLTESLMIIFSVLFALFINEWRTEYNERKDTNLMLDNITMELETNEKFTESLIKYHEEVLENMQGAIQEDSLEEKMFNDMGFYLFDVAPWGIIQGNFKNIAWEVAKSDNISSRIPFSQSKSLFEVYYQQDQVEMSVDRIINILVSREIQDKQLLKESVIILLGEFEEILGQEKVLLKRYQRAKKILKH